MSGCYSGRRVIVKRNSGNFLYSLNCFEVGIVVDANCSSLHCLYTVVAVVSYGSCENEKNHKNDLNHISHLKHKKGVVDG